jgi:predicted PurR-regulated permease PerM
MILLVGILVVFAWYIRTALGPMVIAALLAYLLNPVKNFLEEKLRFPHALATTSVLLITLALIAALPALMIPALLEDFEVLILDLENVLVAIQDFLTRSVVLFGQQIDLENILPDPIELLTERAQRVPENALSLLEAITENLLWLLVIFVAVYYLLRDWTTLRDWLLDLPPETTRSDVKRIFEEVKEVWRGYLRGNLALMVIVGVVFTVAWLVLGVPGALVLGIIAGLLTIIPDLGPAIAAGLAVIVSLVEGSTYLPLTNLWFAVLVAGVYFGLINIKNIWLRPRIFGRSVHMHDGIVFIAIIIAVVSWGILGALIIVPMLASAAIIGRYIYYRALGLPPWPDEQGTTHPETRLPGEEDSVEENCE